MKKSIMKKWVKLLRSGEIKQTQKVLEAPDGSMCCLGVLCNMALLEGVCSYEERHDAQYGSVARGRFDGESGILPESVREWAGIRSSEGDLDEVGYDKLTVYNDQGMTFEGLADIIEENWEHL